MSECILQMPLQCSLKVVYQLVNLFKKDQSTVIRFLGAGLELLNIIGSCIPDVYHLWFCMFITYSGGGVAMYVPVG